MGCGRVANNNFDPIRSVGGISFGFGFFRSIVKM
jgi:hypothetical protein